MLKQKHNLKKARIPRPSLRTPLIHESLRRLPAKCLNEGFTPFQKSGRLSMPPAIRIRASLDKRSHYEGQSTMIQVEMKEIALLMCDERYQTAIHSYTR